MRFRWHFLSLVVPAVFLLLAGCDDSKNPLSDPTKTSKPDERLVGLWLEGSGGGETYYHVGQAGEKFPAGMMRIVAIKHSEGGVEPPEEYFAFPTVLGDKTYLNVVWEPTQVKRLDEKGWKADAVDSYTFLRYQFDGDKVAMWTTDDDAKQKAIQDGKVKGVLEPNKPAKFTGTTENVARFVAQAGDSLWNTKEPGRFERVRAGKKP